MTEILGNGIIHEFVGLSYENPNLYHERQYKRSKWDPHITSAKFYYFWRPYHFSAAD